MTQAKESMGRGLGALAVVGLAVALSGCAYGLGSEFSRTAQQPAAEPVVKEAVLTDDAVPLTPAALVEVEPLPAAKVAPAAAATSNAVRVSGFPNLSEVPPVSNSKLLTPEEKAKVIAELEALAKRQGVEIAKERATAASACDNLSSEELRKRMLQGAC